MAESSGTALYKGLICMSLALCGVFALKEMQNARSTDRWDRLDARALQALTAQPLALDGSVAYLKAYANAALAQRRPDYTQARAALQSLVTQSPENPETWNMLAFVETAANGYFTRETVIALRNSYKVAPFGGSKMMMWRVDFASRYWTALSDDLRADTLAQIPIIAKFGPSWDWREKHCWDNPHQAIYEAICATTPGIPRKGQPIESLAR